MKWMEPALANGELAGKIVCPNKKCGGKIGNYDWAGVCCGCKEWVTPVRKHALVSPPLLLCVSLTTGGHSGLLHSSFQSRRNRRVIRARVGARTLEMLDYLYYFLVALLLLDTVHQYTSIDG